MSYLIFHLFINTISERKKENLIVENFKNLKGEKIIKLLNLLHSMLIREGVAQNIPKLNSFLKHHRREIVQYCQDLKNNNNSILQSLDDLRMKIRNEEDISTEDRDMFLNLIIQIFQKIDPLNPGLDITAAQIKFFCMEDHWNALQILNTVEKKKMNLVQELIIEKLKKKIKKKISKKNLEKELDVKKMMIYEDSCNKTAKLMENSSNLYLDFWINLSKEKPNPHLLTKLAMKAGEINFKIKKKFKNLKFERCTLRMSLLCSEFAHLVLNDEEFITAIQEKLENSRRKFSFQKNFQELLNEKTSLELSQNWCKEALLKVEVNDSELGLIRYCSGDVNFLFETNPEDLIGSQMNELIPKFFLDQHKILVKNFFKSKKMKTKVENSKIWIADEEGYLKEIILTVIPSNNTEFGFEFFAHFKEKKFEIEDSDLEIFQFLIEKDTGEIIAVSKNCSDNYGISNKIIEDKTTPLYIENIIKNFDKIVKEEDLVNKEFELNINTEFIKENFLVQGNHEEEKEEYEIMKEDSFGSRSSDPLFEEELKSEILRDIFNERFKSEKISASAQIIQYGDMEIIDLKFVNDESISDYLKTEKFKKEKILFEKMKSEKESEIEENEIFDEIEEEKRFVEEEINRLREEKEPIKVALFRRLMIIFLSIFFFMYIGEFFLKRFYENKLETIVSYYLKMETRGVLVSRAGYLGSKFLTARR